MKSGDISGATKKPYINLIGNQYGRLTVVSLVEDIAGAKVHTRWLCKCECGNEIVVMGYNLRNGNTTSCGCKQKEKAAARFKTHGETGQRLYVIWQHMRRRCNKPSEPCYHLYGGRGITVCEEWHKYETFRDWALANGYADHLTLDRIDVDGNYEPNNCRWITQGEQTLNRRNNVRIAFNGETKTISEWAKDFGCYQSAVCRQILEREGRIIGYDGGCLNASE